MGTLKLNKKVENIRDTSAIENEKSVVKTPVNKLEKLDVAEINADDIELCELAKQDDGFVEELKDLRTASETVYRRNDRTCRKTITATPTRYLDTNGELKQISNRLIDKGSEIINEANSFKIKFNKVVHSGKIFDLQKGKNVLSLSAVGTSQMRNHACGCKCELCSDKDNAVVATLNDGTEIEYVAMSDRVKENIIIKERQDTYEYDFKLNISDLAVEEGEHNDLLLKDKETGKTEFIIPAPYMYDANGKRSDNVSYVIDVNGEELEIKVVADAEFINSEGRAFPVKIDPQIIEVYGNVFTYYTEYWATHNAENSIYEGEMRVYAESSNNADESVYITIKKSNLKIDGIIEKVELYIEAEPNAHGYFKLVDNIDNKVYVLAERAYNLDITELYKQSDGDCCFSLYGDTDTYKNSSSSGSFYSEGEKAPKLIITYLENVKEYGDDIHPSIKEYKLNEKVSSFLNLYTGETVTEVSDLTVGDKLPVNISHIYKSGKNDNGVGLNWQLNLVNERLIKIDSETKMTKFRYVDAHGDNYSFYEKYFYYDNTGKKTFVDKDQVTLTPNGELFYQGKKVYSHQACNGNTLIAHIEDFIDSELIEQRQNEQIQLEEMIKSYKKSLSKLVILNIGKGSRQGETVKYIAGLNKADFIALVKEAEKNESYLIMRESEAMQMKSYYMNLKQYESQVEQMLSQLQTYQEIIDKYKNNEKGYTKDSDEHKKTELEKNLLESRLVQMLKEKESLIFQQEYYVRQLRENLENLNDEFTTYLIKEREFDRYKRNIPQNYLCGDDGIIRGFSSDGLLVYIFDGYNNVIKIEYDDNNRIFNIYENEQNVAEFKYKNGLLDSVTDKRGRRTSYVYDSDKQLIKILYSDEETLEIVYSSKLIRSVMTDNGMQVKFSSDKLKRLTGIEKHSKPVTVGATVICEKDAFSKKLSALNIEYGSDETGKAVTRITDGENGCENYTFTAEGRIYRQTSRDNNFVTTAKSYTYDVNGNVIKTVTQNDLKQTEEETFEYDILNRVIKAESGWSDVSDTVKSKTVKNYEYDLDGKLIKIITIEKTDVSGTVTPTTEITNYSYNPQGSLTLTESYIEGEEATAGKNYEQRVYDENGVVTKTISWNSLDSTSKFYTESDRAENGQVTADRDETGEVSAEYEYVDGTNVVNAVKYPNGSKFAYGRNPNNLEVTGITHSTDDGEANVTDVTYNYGLPVEVKSGNTTLGYTYDYSRRKTAVSVNGVTQSTYSYKDYTYNTNQNKCTFGEQTTMLNDGKGTTTMILQSKTGVLDTASGRIKVTEIVKINGTKMHEKSYDENGRLTSVTESVSGTRTYAYDNYDNVTSISGGGLTETYTYNEYGDVVTKALTGAVSQTYTYAYKDNAARGLDSISFGDYKFKQLSDVNGRNTGREVYNGENKVAAEYITYRKVGDHATNMPATVWFGSGSEIKDSIKYKYDSCGNICRITENGHVVAKYTYDSLNRLVREDNKLSGNTTVFAYDNAGNITEKCVYDYTSKSGEEFEELNCTHYSYDYEGDRLKSYNGETFAYNGLGNPTTYRGKTCNWQYGNRLTKLGDTTFVYDGLGRRISKGSITFTYDSEGRLLKQSDGLEFVYDSAGVVGVKYNGKQYFYRKDAQGNIIAILDNSGNIVVKYVYDAWGNNAVTDKYGNDITSGIGVLNPFRYRGYYYDTETELYFLQTRYYDPEIGRFISQDSIEYADPESINGLNLYAYCGNNPIMYVDPTGTSWSSFWSGVGRFLGGVALTAIGFSIGLVTAIPSLMNPAATLICEFGLTVGFYGVGLVGSVFDSAIYSDMQLIGWNPYNSNADAAALSQKMSFYKGVPIIRYGDYNKGDRSGTIGIMLLARNDSAESVKHEFGHVPQLIMLGTGNFLFTVGLPSLKKWGLNKYWDDYYVSPWEAMAEMLGGASLSDAPLTSAERSRAIKYLIASYFMGPFVHSFYSKL